MTMICLISILFPLCRHLKESLDHADLICITGVVKVSTKLKTSACASVLLHGLEEACLCVFMSQTYWEE